MLPVLTVIGIQAAAVIGGVVVLESVFSLPGFGTLMIDAVRNRDYIVVQSALMLVAAAVILINLVTDVLYAYVDPQGPLRLGRLTNAQHIGGLTRPL